MGLSLSSERFASSPFPILIAERPSRRRPSKVGLTIRGEPAGRHEPRAACLYSVGQRDPNHDAVIRIGSLAPRWALLGSDAMRYGGFPPTRVIAEMRLPRPRREPSVTHLAAAKLLREPGLS